MASFLIPFELHLQPALPTVLGNIDYHQLRQQLQRTDELLIHGGLETQFVQKCLEQWLAECAPRQPSAKAQLRFQEQSRLALRCNIARILLGESYRDFAVRLADSPLLQSFCAISRMDKIRVPSKSTLERYNQWALEAQVRELVGQASQATTGLGRTTGSPPPNLTHPIGRDLFVRTINHFPR